MALPAISSGIFGFPNYAVAHEMSEVICNFCLGGTESLRHIYLVDIRPEMIDLLVAAFNDRKVDMLQLPIYEGHVHFLHPLAGASSAPSSAPSAASSSWLSVSSAASSTKSSVSSSSTSSASAMAKGTTDWGPDSAPPGTTRSPMGATQHPGTSYADAAKHGTNKGNSHTGYEVANTHTNQNAVQGLSQSAPPGWTPSSPPAFTYQSPHSPSHSRDTESYTDRYALPSSSGLSQSARASRTPTSPTAIPNKSSSSLGYPTADRKPSTTDSTRSPSPTGRHSSVDDRLKSGSPYSSTNSTSSPPQSAPQGRYEEFQGGSRALHGGSGIPKGGSGMPQSGSGTPKGAEVGSESSHRSQSGCSGTQDDCCICLSPITNPRRLEKCGHTFCSGCIAECFKRKPVCPVCGKTYGKVTGTQPLGGKMTHKMENAKLPGHKNCGTIVIEYDIPSGTQTSEHPNPGKYHSGLRRKAYLPNNSKGRKVLAFLEQAFDARLTFTVGRSVTTGKDNVVTWNDIHHKTNRDGGPQGFGYPDPDYLDRVLDELAAKGIQ